MSSSASDVRPPLALVPPAPTQGGPAAALGPLAPVRKIAAILCADVVGYSRLMGEDDVGTLHDILATRRLFQRHVADAHGRLVDTAGDSMLADFGSAVEALRAAVAIQQELAADNALKPEARRMQLRIGLNIGDILEHQEALYGDAVNVAARLQALGEVGGVCVSAAVHDLVAGRLPVAFEYAGEQAVKNVAHPVGVYHARWGGEADDAMRVMAQFGTRAAVERPHRLPQALSSFVGRADEIQTLQNLAGQHRLITLIGPGGIGKTRLAQRLAELRIGPQAVWFADLSALQDERVVPHAVAAAMGLHDDAGRSEAAMLERMRHRRSLLVLDNCEHVPLACAGLARRLLAAEPRLQILATSRVPLKVTGELAYPLPLMQLPADGDVVGATSLGVWESTRLFMERASTALPGFAVDDSQAAIVARICQRLDGMPLAIELAAARVRVMSLHDIERRLDRVFGLLVGGDPSASPRQQTLSATIDWSHQLLDEAERIVFRRVAAFSGSWSLEAAEAVTGFGAIERDDVIELLGRLVEKSLVMRMQGRYRMLQTMRQYAGDRLRESGEAAVVRGRHLAHFVELAESARTHLAGPEQGAWLARLDAERDNLFAAHAWCDEAADGGPMGLRLIFALKLYLYGRGQLRFLQRGLEEAIARPSAQARDVARCRALHSLGQVLGILDRREDARPYLEEALAIAEDLGDGVRCVMVLQELGLSAMAAGDLHASEGYLRRCLAHAEHGSDARAQAAACSALGHWHRVRGDSNGAEALYLRSLALASGMEDASTIAVALMNLAFVAMSRRDDGEAAQALLEAGAIAQRIGSRPAGQCLLAAVSGLAAACEDWALAVRLSAAAEAEGHSTGMQLDPADRALLEPAWRRAREALGDRAGTEAARARASGYEASLHDAIEWLEGVARRR